MLVSLHPVCLTILFSHPNETSGPQDNQNLSKTDGNEQALDLDPPVEPPRRSDRVRQDGSDPARLLSQI